MKDTGPSVPARGSSRMQPNGGVDHGVSPGGAASPLQPVVSPFAQRRFRVRVRDEERALLRRVVEAFADPIPLQGDEARGDPAMAEPVRKVDLGLEDGRSRLYRD